MWISVVKHLQTSMKYHVFDSLCAIFLFVFVTVRSHFYHLKSVLKENSETVNQWWCRHISRRQNYDEKMISPSLQSETTNNSIQQIKTPCYRIMVAYIFMKSLVLWSPFPAYKHRLRLIKSLRMWRSTLTKTLRLITISQLSCRTVLRWNMSIETYLSVRRAFFLRDATFCLFTAPLALWAVWLHRQGVDKTTETPYNAKKKSFFRKFHEV